MKNLDEEMIWETYKEIFLKRNDIDTTYFNQQNINLYLKLKLRAENEMRMADRKEIDEMRMADRKEINEMKK